MKYLLIIFYRVMFDLLNLNFDLDKIKRTLGEGTFGKVVEVKDGFE
jgi:hypothetical protein